MFLFLSKIRSSLKFSTTKVFVQCYRVLPIFHRPDESVVYSNTKQQYHIIIAFEELNDEGSDTVFHA